MATISPPLSSPSLSSNAHFSSQYTSGHPPAKSHVSDVLSTPPPDKTYPASIASTPEVQINGRPRQSRPSTSSASTHTHEDMTWGSHFWVTLVDPQASFTLNPSIYSFAMMGLIAVLPLRRIDPGIILRMPGDRTSFLGPSSRELRVRTHTIVSWTPASWRNWPVDYRPATPVSGGRLAMSPVAVFHTITTRRLARLYGKSPMVSSSH